MFHRKNPIIHFKNPFFNPRPMLLKFKDGDNGDADGKNGGGGGGGTDDKGDAGKDGATGGKEGDGKGGKGDDKSGDGKGGTDDDKSGDDKGKKGGEKTFTQAELDQVVKDRLAREAKKSEDAKKIEEGKFKELYDPLKVSFDKLETEHTTLKGKYDGLVSTLNSSIDAEIKDWPDSIKKLDPGTADYEARSKWRDNSRAVVEELGGKKKGNFKTEHGGNSGGSGNGQSEALKKVTMRSGPAGLKRS
jgi:hypothetical protein